MPFSIRPNRRLPLTYFSGFMSLITLLVLSSGPAYAEWEAVLENDEAGVAVHVDRDTIRPKGNLAKIWQLFDFKTIQTVSGSSPFLSIKVQSEYDCVEEQRRELASTHFSGNMERGRVLYSVSVKHQWEPVAPVSMAQRLWKIACDKK
jgi:hypothetical protein